jgi:pimeloyl-[acyl-carrier protein] methyl ester esterase
MNLHCRALGTGREIVLLHGWGTHGGIWAELAPALAEHFRVHVVDLPGYGGSAKCNPYDLDHMAALLMQEMPPRCGVVGWSLGGQLGLAWAARAPRQVERMALIATTPCFLQRADWPHAVSDDELREFRSALAADSGAALQRFYALEALGDERPREVMARLRAGLEEGGAPSRAALAGGLDLLFETDQRAELAAISQPVLVLHGAHDRVTPLAAGEHLCRNLSNAELIVIPGAAHVPFISALPEVSARLVEFFQ